MKQYMTVMLLDDVISGTSDNGNSWEKQMVVFETTGDSKKPLAVEFMGERKTKVTKQLKPGQLCEVVFEPVSREYEGKWYTRLDGISVTPLEKAQQQEEEKPVEG